MGEREFSRRRLLQVTAAAALTVAAGGTVIEALNIINGLNSEKNSQGLVVPSHDILTPTPYESPYPSETLIPPSLKPIETPIPTPTPTQTLEPTPKPTPKPSPEIAKLQTAQVIFHGDTSKKVIYLTFDDCWSPNNVQRIFDTAENYGIKITFFPVGSQIADNPALWAQIREKGHAIENHTWSHKHLINIPESTIIDQIKRQRAAVQNAVGSDYKQYFLRPPGGDGIFGGRNPLLLDACAKLGYKVAMWSSDSNGWRKGATDDSQAAIDYVESNVFHNFYKGVVVLQHAIADDIAAMPAIIEKAQNNGWQMDTLRHGLGLE